MFQLKEIKFVFDGLITRYKLDSYSKGSSNEVKVDGSISPVDILRLSNFKDICISLFTQLEGKQFHFIWKDSEQDSIAILSDIDLYNAYIDNNKSTLKLEVNISESSRMSDFNSQDIRHECIVCDECNATPIIGVRYKCSVRKNYNICSNCESKRSQLFPMLKIYHPDQNHLYSVQLFQQYVDSFDLVREGTRSLASLPASLSMSSLFPGSSDDSIIVSAVIANSGNENERAIANSCMDEDPYSPPSETCHETLGDVDISNSFFSTASLVEMPMISVEFIDHVTIPDGTIVNPGTTFLKIWRIRNNGTHSWPEDLHLVIVDENDSYDSPHIAPTSASGTVAPGEQIDVMMHIRAPAILGQFMAYYTLSSKTGQLVDESFRLCVDVDVQEETGWASLSGILKTNGRFLDSPCISRETSSDSVGMVMSGKRPCRAKAVGRTGAETGHPFSRSSSLESLNDLEDVNAPSEPVTQCLDAVSGDGSSSMLKYQLELGLLHDMGFRHSERNLELLQQHMSCPVEAEALIDLDRLSQVVAILISEEASPELDSQSSDII